MSTWPAGSAALRLLVGDEHLTDPAGFCEDRLGEHLWSKQVEILEAVRDYKRTAVQSCHGVGKSFTAARAATWWLSCHPAGEAFVVSTAPTFPQVRAVLWREIGRAHRNGGLPGRVNQTEWWIGEELVGFGRKPADYNPVAFQGIHAAAVLVIIDEAAGVPASMWDSVETITTTDRARILAIGNPDDPHSEFARRCSSPQWHRIRISAFDSPNFTGEAVPPQVAEQLVTPRWVQDRGDEWGVDSPLYVAKVLGEFPTESEDQLIKYRWVARAQERWADHPDRDTGTPVQVAVDVARYGTNKTVVGVRRGMWVSTLDVYPSTSTVETAEYARTAHTTSRAEIVRVDGVGVGGGVVDTLEEWGVPVDDWNAGAAAVDNTRFVNARAEAWWTVRDLLEAGARPDTDPATAIALPPDEALAAQLCAPRYTIRRGRISLESKDDMANRGIPSPDHADTVVMMYAGRTRREVQVY